jgi:hypothetical protein
MTEAEREAEIASWIWDDLRCPAGHIIRKPVLRLEAIVSLKCATASCDASFEYPRDWFQVGKRIECVFCGQQLTLTEEDIMRLE